MASGTLYLVVTYLMLMLNIRGKHFSVSVHTDITLAALNSLNKFPLSFKIYRTADK